MARAVLLGVAVAALMHGQSTQGLISGRVIGQDGRDIGEAEVIAESLATSTRAVTRTRPDGYFTLPLLPPGMYRISAAAAGYQRQEIDEMELAVAAFLDLPFTLRPLNDVWESRQSRSLILPGGGALLRFYGPDLDLSRTLLLKPPQPNRGGLESTISTTIDPGLIQNLPLVGRDVYSALVLQPGVSASTTTARGLGVSVGGQRPSSAHFLLDGLENNNQLITGPLSTIVPESVQEFRLSTSSFSAEYGWTSGYLANAVTKAGTSSWHGLLYFNGKNEALNANDFARNAKGQPRSPFKEQQAGFQAGGPVWRDRLFQSTSVDYLRTRGQEDPLRFYVPSSSFIESVRRGEPSLARTLLTTFAVPQAVSQPTGDYAPASMAPPVSLNRLVALERIDYTTPGGAHRLFGRLSFAPLSRPDFIWSPYKDFSSPLDQNATSVALGHTSRAGADVTNELRGGFSTDLIEFRRAHPEIPTLVGGGADAPVILPGSLAAYSYRNHTRAWQASDNLVWVRGRHVVKVGGGFLTRSLNGYLTFAQAGEYTFPNLDFFFRLDQPTKVRIGLSREARAQGRQVSPDYDRRYRVTQFHAFVQDSFRATPRLSLNYGLRYEYGGVPVNTGVVQDAEVRLGAGSSLPERLSSARMFYPGGGGALYSARRVDWAARAGFSFRPFASGDTLVRGSAGIFYDRGFDNLWQNLRNNNVVLGTGPLIGPIPYLDPVNSLVSVLPRLNLDSDASRLTLYQPRLRTPRVDVFFLGVRQQFGALAIEANGQASYGHGLITTDLVNRTFSRPGIDDGRQSRYHPDLEDISYRANQGGSSYHALSVLANYRRGPLNWQLAYAWSHSIDNQSEPLSGEYFDLSFLRPANSGRTLRSAFAQQFDSRGDRGNSDFDQRHNLALYVTWESPAAWPAALRRWTISSLAAVRSGLPFTVTAPIAGSSSLVNNRASLVAPASQDSPAAGGRILLRSDAFVAPGSALGNTGRNAFRGPGFYGVDLSVSRSFAVAKLGEGGRLTLRADAYNVLNHANLGNPDALISSPTFGLARYGRQEASSGFPALFPLRETNRQIQCMVRIAF